MTGPTSGCWNVLRRVAVGAHVVGGPHPGKFLASGEELTYQPGHLGITGITGGGGPQVLGRPAGELVRVLYSLQPPPIRVRP